MKFWEKKVNHESEYCEKYDGFEILSEPFSVRLETFCGGVKDTDIGSLEFNNVKNSATPSMEETDFSWFPYLKRKIKY